VLHLRLRGKLYIIVRRDCASFALMFAAGCRAISNTGVNDCRASRMRVHLRAPEKQATSSDLSSPTSQPLHAPCGSALDSFVDFGATYVVCLFTWYAAYGGGVA